MMTIWWWWLFPMHSTASVAKPALKSVPKIVTPIRPNLLRLKAETVRRFPCPNHKSMFSFVRKVVRPDIHAVHVVNMGVMDKFIRFPCWFKSSSSRRNFKFWQRYASLVILYGKLLVHGEEQSIDLYPSMGFTQRMRSGVDWNVCGAWSLQTANRY